MIVFIAVLVVRPLQVEIIMHQLPLLKSMRWPFREILQLQFFVHLFIILRPSSKTAPGSWPWPCSAWWLSRCRFPSAARRPWTAGPLTEDASQRPGRPILTQVKAHELKPGDLIATVIDVSVLHHRSRRHPLHPAGYGNFPRLLSGQIGFGIFDHVARRPNAGPIPAGYWFGGYREDQIADFLKYQPGVRLIRLEGTHPLKITLSSGNQPPVDLNPLFEIRWHQGD